MKNNIKVGDKVRLVHKTLDSVMEGVVQQVSGVMEGVHIVRFEGVPNGQFWTSDWGVTVLESAKPDRPAGLYIAEGVVPYVAVPLRVREGGGEFELAYDSAAREGYDSFARRANTGEIRMVQLITKEDSND